MTTSVRTSSIYADEGGGEDDMTAFDIKPLQIPVEGTAVDESVKIPLSSLGPALDIGLCVEEYRKKADEDLNSPPFDDLRNYAYEEGGSTAGTDDKEQEFDYLVVWGPRFDMLANMYGHKNEENEEGIQEEKIVVSV
uniref:Cadherin Y-type LIR-motif domain-containing protein n=1 Tax=Timema tahoe TaxID=61484 RepID=A0A7R9FI75_9NEOP|nr:unnamed protein product [Timema tahoe]